MATCESCQGWSDNEAGFFFPLTILGFSLLIMILPLFHIHLWAHTEICSTPEHSANYNISVISDPVSTWLFKLYRSQVQSIILWLFCPGGCEPASKIFVRPKSLVVSRDGNYNCILFMLLGRIFMTHQYYLWYTGSAKKMYTHFNERKLYVV